MRLKTYTAASMAQAMAQIRGELGQDAIIVSSETDRGGRSVRVVAAVDEAKSGRSGVRRLERRAAIGGPGGARRRCRPGAGPSRHSGDTRQSPRPGGGGARTGGRDRCSGRRSRRIALLPADGRQARATAVDAGRAAWCRQDDGGGENDRSRAPSRRDVVAITCDSARAGGVQQLEAFTRILGLELLTADTPQALATFCSPPMVRRLSSIQPEQARSASPKWPACER